ncbi:hypothetical protein MPSEU_000997500 [Mayamaea pseudoterrestris]|nr:hypothetical protein MPSEU_000997500 [Mayamaea pseudoterrestris]
MGSEELLATALLGFRSGDSSDSSKPPKGNSNGSERSEIFMGNDFRGISMNSLASLGFQTQAGIPQSLLTSPSLASFTNLLHLQGNPNFSFSRNMGNGFHQPSPTLLAMQQQQQQQQQQQPTVQALNTQQVSRAAPSTPPTTNTTSPSAVHKDKVASALLSHPQRGRKRDELNEEERHELTRTRNREHARATRVRKKHRYDELVEKERQLEELLQRRELERKRRDIVIDLFQTREKRIRSLAMTNTAMDGSSSPSVPLVDDSEHSTRPADNDVASNGKVDDSQHPKNTQEDSTDSKSLRENEGLKETLRMRKFDDDIAKRIVDEHGPSSLAKFSYNVIGLANGVALDGNDGALVTVELLVVDEQIHSLMRGLVYIQFVANAATFQSVSWTTLEESFGDGLTEQSSGSSSVSLEQLAPATTIG